MAKSIHAQPGITVTGAAVVQGQPDIALVNLGVEHSDAALPVAYNATAAAMAGIMAALMESGVVKTDIATANLHVYRQTRQTASKDYEYIFNVGNTIMLTIHDLDRIPELIGTAISHGATTLHSLSFAVADPKPLMSSAREQAIADARAKAEELAGAAGVHVGKPLQIVEGSDMTVSTMQPSERLMQFDASVEAMPVNADRVSITAQVRVTFRLE